MARLILSQQVENLQALNASLQRQVSVTNASFDALQYLADSRSVRIADLQKQADLLPALNEQVVNLTKALEAAKITQGYLTRNYDERAADIEQAHAVLDAVEGCPSREYEIEGNYGKTKRQLVTRLAGAFLAIAKTGGMK